MENKIVTMANSKFGTVRKLYEGNKVIFCGADVAKALGYTNSRKALADHCKGVTKRYTPTSSIAKHDTPISCRALDTFNNAVRISYSVIMVHVETVKFIGTKSRKILKNY